MSDSERKNVVQPAAWWAAVEERMNSGGELAVAIGEWGTPDGKAGYIMCSEADREAVQAAYDTIEDGDLSSDVLSGVFAAGDLWRPSSNAT